MSKDAFTNIIASLNHLWCNGFYESIDDDQAVVTCEWTDDVVIIDYENDAVTIRINAESPPDWMVNMLENVGWRFDEENGEASLQVPMSDDVAYIILKSLFYMEYMKGAIDAHERFQKKTESSWVNRIASLAAEKWPEYTIQRNKESVGIYISSLKYVAIEGVKVRGYLIFRVPEKVAEAFANQHGYEIPYARNGVLSKPGQCLDDDEALIREAEKRLRDLMLFDAMIHGYDLAKEEG